MSSELFVKTLRWITAISALAVIAVIVITQRATARGPIPLERWQLGLILLPWVVHFAAFFPLVHRSWFKRPLNPVWRAILIVFYWLAVSCSVVVFGGAYLHFVFRWL